MCTCLKFGENQISPLFFYLFSLAVHHRCLYQHWTVHASLLTLVWYPECLCNNCFQCAPAVFPLFVQAPCLADVETLPCRSHLNWRLPDVSKSCVLLLGHSLFFQQSVFSYCIHGLLIHLVILQMGYPKLTFCRHLVRTLVEWELMSAMGWSVSCIMTQCWDT